MYTKFLHKNVNYYTVQANTITVHHSFVPRMMARNPTLRHSYKGVQHTNTVTYGCKICFVKGDTVHLIISLFINFLLFSKGMFRTKCSAETDEKWGVFFYLQNLFA